MYATFNRFEICISKQHAEAMSHPGPCDDDVEFYVKQGRYQRQFAKIEPAEIIRELRGYGAWDDDELRDDEQNQRRVLWLAAGMINDPTR